MKTEDSRQANTGEGESELTSENPLPGASTGVTSRSRTNAERERECGLTEAVCDAEFVGFLARILASANLVVFVLYAASAMLNATGTDGGGVSWTLAGDVAGIQAMWDTDPGPATRAATPTWWSRKACATAIGSNVPMSTPQDQFRSRLSRVWRPRPLGN
jgi:hypothetical protein